MLDIKEIRKNYDQIYHSILRRGKGDFGLEQVRELDEKKRDILAKVEELRSETNQKSKLIPQYKKENKDVSQLLSELKEIANKTNELEVELREIDSKLEYAILCVPNLPNDDITTGNSEEDNKVIRSWGEPKEFDFEVKPHWQIGEERGFLDSKRASKVSGSRFTYIVGRAAKLERALINFMLDYHTNNDKYKELNTPVLVSREAMTGTGQLPKFEEDAFKVTGASDRELFLIPTAEVSLTNYFREEILQEDELPMYITAYTPCFRKEAGSAGKDTRGIIRQHQFDKVELVKFVEPETSMDELEDMVTDVEELLQALEIPYRVVELCTGDLGFSASKTYDLEIWFPSAGMYREVSSVSCFTDYQARRASIRYRRKKDNKVSYVHTLNGSGLAVGRTLAAIMENHQLENGKIRIPTVLSKYMGGLSEI